jgi:hypothetical protein
VDAEQAAEIDRVRREWCGSLAGVNRKHITLVLPFESELTEDGLEAHMRAAAEGIERFAVEL